MTKKHAIISLPRRIPLRVNRGPSRVFSDLEYQRKEKVILGGNVMELKIRISWDNEASVYIAVCDDIGLALESASYDELIRRVMDTVPELIELNNIKGCTSYSFLTEERQVACA